MLIAQFQDVHPRAQMEFKETSRKAGDNQAAWAAIIAKLSSRKRARDAHPVDVLRQALVHYLVFGGSTSGVEQGFSKAAWAVHSRRHQAKASTEDLAVKVTLDNRCYDERALLPLARKCWSVCYGAPRVHDVHRIDKGVTKLLQDEDGAHGKSEAAFIRKRRKAAASAGANQSLDSEVNTQELDIVWTEKHDAEKLFLRKKMKCRRVQAFAEKSLLDDEITPELLADREACAQKLEKNEADRVTKKLRTQAKMGCCSSDALAFLGSGCVYMAVTAMAAPALADLQLAIARHGLRVTTAPKDAVAIVCDRPGRLADKRLRLLSALLGWYEMSPTCFTGDGNGAALKLKCACDLQRVLIVSHRCATPHVLLSALGCFGPMSARTPRKLLFGSDFSGLDSAWIALQRLKVPAQLQFCSDIDPDCKNLLLTLHKPARFHDNVATRSPDDEAACDCYVFTPPCQSFSVQGKRRGLKDPRAAAMKGSFQYIKRKHPRVVLFENVKGITHKAFRPVLNGMRAALKKLGYVVWMKVLDSSNFRVAQVRRRLFVVGILRTSYRRRFKWPAGQGKKRLACVLDPLSPTDKAGRLPKGARPAKLARIAYQELTQGKFLLP